VLWGTIAYCKDTASDTPPGRGICEKESLMPTMRIDLHMHTCYSDGSDTPWQLVAKAAQQGLQSIAITDHDTVAAISEARQAGVVHGVEVVAGIELSVRYERYHDVHMLGYLFDPQHERLGKWLQYMQEQRVQRGMAILERVNACLTQRGQAPLDTAQVLQDVHGTLTRPHVAKALIAQGYVRNMEEAFREFLIPCDVPKAGLSPEAAMALMAEAGGVCVLAHPGVLSAEPKELERLIRTFKTMGMAGIEAYHHSHEPGCVDFLVRCARRYGLVVTGGSDYHGRAYGAQLGETASGEPIPGHLLADLQQVRAGLRQESA
jgi:predicted metal-dependent phosphoesterase TrpH